MLKPIKVILVDDEPEACENLQNIISQFITDEIDIVACAYNTSEAESKIKSIQPDAIFLDIEMPNENAFQFLERLEKISFEIVFVTAYDEYAIRAFKLNAVDYILKPINIEDLTNAIAKLKEKVIIKRILKNDTGNYREIAEQITKKKKQQQIVLSDNNHWETVNFGDIIYVKAMGSYSKIYYMNETGEQSIIMSRSIAEYEEILPPELFFRIHRSVLINCQYVEKILKGETKFLLLQNKTQLPIGRRRYTELVNFLKNYDIAET